MALLLAAGLAGLIGLELRDASWAGELAPTVPAGVPPGITQAVPGEKGLGPASPILRGQWAAEALARPLFDRDRRPLSQPQTTATVASAGMPRLTGVIVHGTERSAILVPVDGGKPVVAREGAQAAGVTVQAIKAGQVTVLGPGGTRVLLPSYDPRPPAAAQALPGPGSTGAPQLGPAFNAAGALAPPPASYQPLAGPPFARSPPPPATGFAR